MCISDQSQWSQGRKGARAHCSSLPSVIAASRKCLMRQTIGNSIAAQQAMSTKCITLRHANHVRFAGVNSSSTMIATSASTCTARSCSNTLQCSTAYSIVGCSVLAGSNTLEGRDVMHNVSLAQCPNSMAAANCSVVWTGCSKKEAPASVSLPSESSCCCRQGAASCRTNPRR